MSKYNVGDRWKAVGRYGEIAEVYLDKKYPSFEVWVWEFCYGDGSGGDSDWTTTRANAVNQVKSKFDSKEDRMNIRMKRVKE